MNIEQQGLMAILRLVCQAMGTMLQQNDTLANSVMELQKKVEELESKESKQEDC